MKHNADQKVIILTITDADEMIREALDAGARGFVLKSDAGRDLILAVEAMQRNRTFFTSRVNDLVLAGFLDRGQKHPAGKVPKLPKLKPRECEGVQLLAQGKRSSER